MPTWILYVAIAALAVGIFGLMLPFLPQRRKATSVDDRVTDYAMAFGVGGRSESPTESASISHEVGDAAKGAAAGLLNRIQGLEDKIARRLNQAGSPFKSAEWLLLHVAITVGAGLFGLLASGGNLIVGIGLTLAGLVIPWTYLGIKRNRLRAAFERALPDTLQLMAGSLTAGLSLQQAVDVVGSDGIEPVAGEFRRVLAETRLNVSIEDSLEAVATRFDSTDLNWVVMAIRIQRQVGGNLAELLTTVGGTIRERDYVRRQVRALSAEGRLSATVLGLLPPLFLLYLALTSWDYVEPLFTDVRGVIMLIGATAWLGVGVFWMSKTVAVEV